MIQINIGDIFDTNFGKCEICDIESYAKIKVRFIKTGYESYCKMSDLKKGHVKDYLYPSVKGIGYLGNDFKNIKKNKKLYKKSYQVWKDMIKRCYDKKSVGYRSYGSKGTYISDEWKNFSIFYKDIQTLHGYNEKDFLDGKIFLDKDLLQINDSKKVYSKNTCVFLSKNHNNLLQDHSDETITFKVTYPDGKTEIFSGIRKFARIHNINFTNISACLKGKLKTYKKMKFEIID